MTKREELLVVLRDAKMELYTLERIIKMKEDKVEEIKVDISVWKKWYRKKVSFYNNILEDLKKDKGE